MDAETISRQNVLTGALIGLARATEGNECLVTPETDALVIEVLHTTAPDEDSFTALRNRIHGEKYRIVPDCSTCASPCGRTSDYDMAELGSEGGDIHNLKLQILDGVREAAGNPAAGKRMDLIYKGLILVGMAGESEKQLRAILEELQQA